MRVCVKDFCYVFHSHCRSASRPLSPAAALQQPCSSLAAQTTCVPQYLDFSYFRCILMKHFLFM